MKISKAIASTVALLALASPAAAVVPLQVLADSYDMPNGSGQAIGGTFNYWDANYAPASSANTNDGATLYGGSGKLTDGIVSTSQWFLVSNNSGTGEYVGWTNFRTASPEITFHFSGSPLITDIKIQMDNTESGGVFAPSAVYIDGTPFAGYAPPPATTVGTVDFNGLHLTGSTHKIKFDYPSITDQRWIFVSEVQFFSAAVPEASTWAMMLIGLAGLGLLGHRARAAKAAA